MKKYHRLLFKLSFFLVLLVTGSCMEDYNFEWPTVSTDAELIFQSGFEGSSKVVRTSNNQIDDIIGIDNTLSSPNDWVADFDEHPNIGEFRIYYEDGRPEERIAEIIPDPTRPGNHVLNFKLTDTNVRDDEVKGRIQADLYRNNGLKEFYQSVRVYFHPDLAALKNYPGRIHWFTLFELWNNAGWENDPHGYRVSINFEKPRNDQEVYFKVYGQDPKVNPGTWTYIWEEINYDHPVPFGEWITLELYVLEGDQTHGRFYLAMTREDGTRQVLFDEYNWTHKPDDPDPDGLGHWNPIKVYTNDKVINYMKEHGKTIQVYWDDYKLWKNRQPESLIMGN